MPVQVTATLLISLLLTFLPGCAGRPVSSVASDDPIVRRALRYQGVPYRYGGTTPKGFDCSGLVQYVYRQEGLRIPRTTRGQWQRARKVARSEIAAGDLLFFRMPGKGLHVGIYVGRERFIHAPSRGKTVRIDPLGPYWWRHYMGAGRYRH